MTGLNPVNHDNPVNPANQYQPVIHVALVGYGLSGKVFHGAVLRDLDDFKVSMIVTTSEEKKKEALHDFSDVQVVDHIDAVLANPQISLVVISTPNQTHSPLAHKALDAGKHVIIEKPFTADSKSAQELVDKAKQKGLVLSVYHNRRFDGDFMILKSLIDQGRLGKIVELESHFDRFRPTIKTEAWKEQDLPGSGILFDLGSHLIDQAIHLFGLPDEVYCDLAKQRQGLVVDQFSVILYYETRGLKVTLKAGSLVNIQLPRFMALGTTGSYATYGLDPQENELRVGARYPLIGVSPHNYGKVFTLEDAETIVTITGDYRLYYHGIYRAITEGIEAPVTAHEAYWVIRIIELAMESHAQKKRLPLIR
jgi:scyllo-inositol 2-dehydrogenase (NADP+)